jgi:hypothetical protein
MPADVTAPDLQQSHPAARRFQNRLFPEWNNLAIIFGAVASGENHKSLGRPGSRIPSGITPSQTSSARISQGLERSDDNSDEDKRSSGHPHRRKRNRKTTGSAFSGAVRDLIEAFGPDSKSSGSNADSTQLSDEDAVSKAVDIFQEGMAHELPMNELGAGFSVLENPSKAQMFIQIDGLYKNSWLRSQIELHLCTTQRH